MLVNDEPLITKDEYWHPWFGNKYFLTMLCVGGILMQSFHIGNILKNYKMKPSLFVAIVVLVFGILLLVNLMFLYIKGPRQTIVKADGILFINLYNRERFIKYDEILKIKPLLWDWSTLAVYTANDYVLLGAKIERFGELIEKILPMVSSATEIELLKLPYVQRAWQKEPDMKIIEAAIERAKINQRKLSGK
ncbi:hypothetical protein [Leptospira koniambonensis]